ncbi:MAG TPA: membrane protein insertion efficiency factor YidD [Thermomicrobiales bacterium]|nr:membrane protein insertion efficiency factor YidD [Thermomicrobiales bacterium]
MRDEQTIEIEDVPGVLDNVAHLDVTPPARLMLAGIVWYRTSRLRVWHHRRGARCRFIPTCSEYCGRAVVKYGAAKGITLTVRRIYRCSSGYQGPYVDFP